MSDRFSRAVRPLFPILAAALLLAAASAPAALGQAVPSARAQAQIRAFAADKRLWTEAQQKLDSHLLYGARMARREAVVPGIPQLPRVWSRLKVDAAGRVEVDIRATVSDALLAGLQKLGGEIVSAFPELGSVRARLPLATIEKAAALPDVRFIGPAEEAVVNRVRRGRSLLPKALGLVTEGDHAHAADVVRTMGITGSGVKVGVLSDGVDSLAAEEGAGHLPAVTVLSGQAGSGDEGTAMLEIVHDLAPNAQLYFATAFNGEASMATNIQNLRNAGCDIIVDDVTYFDEGVFEDGPLAQAVNTVTTSGALYFSSAANSGNKDSGTSGTWEGDFKDSGINSGVGDYHDFGGGNLEDLLTADAGAVTLKWSDPLAGSTNDYDLFLFDEFGDVVDASTNGQTGTQDPYEAVSGQFAGEEIVIILFAGAPRALHLDTQRGQLAINTPGNTYGHNAAGSALTAAAVNVSTAGGGKFTGGAGNPVETYSSDGPRRLFFHPNGSPITAGNFLIATNGGQVLQKPDLTAADCVSSNVSGFDPFCGTSAAAPHAAAIAALAKSMSLHPTAAQVTSCMLGTALDNMAPGIDRDSGHGIVMADRTVSCLESTAVGLKFYILPPCRLIDTRNPTGPLGGPALHPNAIRSFVLPGVCGVPTDARALALNLTVTQPTASGDLRLYPGDAPVVPTASAINFQAGQTRSNNAILLLPLTVANGLNVKSDGAGTVQLIVDIDGYFK